MIIPDPNRAEEIAVMRFKREAEGFIEELRDFDLQYQATMAAMGWDGEDNAFADAHGVLRRRFGVK